VSRPVGIVLFTPQAKESIDALTTGGRARVWAAVNYLKTRPHPEERLVSWPGQQAPVRAIPVKDNSVIIYRPLTREELQRQGREAAAAPHGVVVLAVLPVNRELSSLIESLPVHTTWSSPSEPDGAADIAPDLAPP
jgi:hypothetical protein